MIYFRVIPTLLLENNSCIKTIKFKKKIYLGDPINIVKIFNKLGADEIILYDITKDNNINFQLLKNFSEEAFMPLSYGGKIKSLNDIERILSYGYEKIVLNSCFYNNFNFINSAILQFGTSSVSLCVNLKKNIFGSYYLYDHFKNRIIYSMNLKKILLKLKNINVAEICFNFVDREGMRSGYDIQTMKEINTILGNKNIIINGGAKDVDDLIRIKKIGLNGAVASSIFSFLKSNESILINYISKDERDMIDNY